MSHWLGKALYATLFVVLVPGFIGVWGIRLDSILDDLPAMGTAPIGWTLVIPGFLCMASAWWGLSRHGNGLPMNAYPPRHLVQRGIYSILPHPIYVGFGAMVAGYFILIESGAGFWFVLPCIALGSLALVCGYERNDMKSRFGTADWPTLLRVPEALETAPAIADRVSVYVLLFIPWLLVYEATIALGPAADSVETYLTFEYRLPVVEWMEACYGLTYLFVLSAPLVSRRKRDLRKFMAMGFWATVIAGLCWLILPIKATPRPFESTSLLGDLLAFERSLEGPAGAFPSFHVVWTLLAAQLYANTFRLRALWYCLASMVALSCIATGMHSVVDILGGIVLYVLVSHGSSVWNWLLQRTEYLANSWREWRLGKIRIIDHGFYAGAAAYIGMVLAIHLMGADHGWSVVVVWFATVLGAGLWGQAIEGSSKLLRPFGYYGALLGGSAGVIVAVALGAEAWLLIGACCVAAPFVQAIGRLRCLVQGCCHGRECEPHQGIVYRQARSRVMSVSGLGNRSIYPTPLYSLLYNLVLGLLLMRAWSLALPAPFIAGCYLILGGYGRFVEESYRGEPQTPRYAGLPLYQWCSIVSVVLGATLTMFEGVPYATSMEILPGAFAYAALFGLVTACAMGVDFPESNRRFSRLA